MKKHQIFFNTEMINAILEGKKTQTRRVLKKQPDATSEFIYDGVSNYEDTKDLHYLEETINGQGTERYTPFKFPYGIVGDLLWVPEPFAVTTTISKDYDIISYKIDSFHRDIKHEGVKFPIKDMCEAGWHDKDLAKEVQWKKLVNMPLKYARIWLKITDIRIEKLQDISNEDAIAEGILPLNMSRAQLANQGQLYFDYTKPKQIFNEGISPFWSFNSLWCSIYDGDSMGEKPMATPWEKNPWVWVITFERITK